MQYFLIGVVTFLVTSNFTVWSFTKCGDTLCHDYAVCNSINLTCSCPSIHNSAVQPVCGSDGKVYKNSEELEVTSCNQNRTITLVKEGKCFACNDSRCHPYSECRKDLDLCVCKPVLEIFGPVCGSDGQTYQSKYQLDHTACFNENNVTVAYKGFCKAPGICGHNACHHHSKCNPVTNECYCEDVVSATRAPVCGSDGQTYENKAILHSHSCHVNGTIHVAYEGKCIETGLRCGDPSCHKNSVCNYTSTLCVCPSGTVNDTQTVCGNDRKQYTNAFELEKAACLADKTILIAVIGKCRVPGGKKNLIVIVVPAVVGGVLLIVVLVIVACCVYKKKKTGSANPAEKQGNEMSLLEKT